ncbi:hypothetical protein MMC08_002846 [Hypocenomyce scalaris]|nr:hypothetical protein [Hypocenomyce scalaris]
MSKPKVYVLDPYHTDAIALIKNTPTVTAITPPDPSRNDWHADANGLMIRSERNITAADLAKAPNLRVIVKQGVGVNNIDLEAAKKYGVIVCNTPALNSETVAELAITLALCVARRVCEIDRRVRRGEAIVRSTVLCRSLSGKTIGVIGMGNIGKVVARKWIGAMEGKVVAYDPFAAADAWAEMPHQRVHTLEELLDVADVVTLHVPLTAGTRGMIGAKELTRMKTSAILLNCSRGGIVVEPALMEALVEKKIYGAALDAMEVEPPTLEVYEEILRNENIIMTPHMGANTMENQSRSGLAVVETLLAVLEGKAVPNRLV